MEIKELTLDSLNSVTFAPGAAMEHTHTLNHAFPKHAVQLAVCTLRAFPHGGGMWKTHMLQVSSVT